MIVYVTGIDGAGKSTICNYIKKELEKSGECRCVWARYQPRIVKFLISPFRRKKVSSSKDYNNMSANDYVLWTKAKREKVKKHPIMARLLFCLQYLEYYFQTLGVLSNGVNKNLIVDRYVIDFIVDQTINYGDIAQTFPVKRLLKKVQDFDIVLFVNVDSEVAFKRKNDIPSTEYLDERRMIYMDYINKLPNAVCINNNGDIEDTILEINNVLGL